MEFLKSVVYADNTYQECAGLLLTSYDPKMLYTRPRPLYVPRADLAAHAKDATGWCVNEDGTIMSDSLESGVFPEGMLLSSLTGSSQSLTAGLIDVIRFALKVGGYVLPVYDPEAPGGTDIRIPIKNFRVSQSSFNIYAAYNRGDGFRTMSLLDKQHGHAKPFYIALASSPSPEDQALTRLLEPVGKIDDAVEGPLELFRVTAGLCDSNPFLGAAFANFLAFYVTFNEIGFKLSKMLMPTITQAKSEVIVRQPQESLTRGAKPDNLQIIHTWADCNIAAVIKAIQAGQPAADIMERFNGAPAVMEWIDTLAKRRKETGSSDCDEDWTRVCFDIKADTEVHGLCFALELLEQRYTLFNLGWMLDTSDMIYRGGGVYGCSKKLR